MESAAPAGRFAVATLFGALVASCGADIDLDLAPVPAAPPRQIIGGEPSQAGDLPAVGAIVTRGFLMGSPVGTLVCTGTLIAPDVVVTAAHCTEIDTIVFRGLGEGVETFFTLAPDLLDFGQPADPVSLDIPAPAFEVAGMVAHPSWNLQRFATIPDGLSESHDIALLFLEAAVTEVEPAALVDATDAASLIEGTAVRIAGYGQRDPDDPYTTGVKHHAASFISEVGAAEMQIGDESSGGARKCHGDSGGPTILAHHGPAETAWRVAGVASHTYDGDECHGGGVDTRVDIYAGWIAEALLTACDDGQRPVCDRRPSSTSATATAAPDALGGCRLSGGSPPLLLLLLPGLWRLERGRSLRRHTARPRR